MAEMPRPVAYQYRLARGDYWTEIAENRWREHERETEQPLFTAEQVAELMDAYSQWMWEATNTMVVDHESPRAAFRALYCKDYL